MYSLEFQDVAFPIEERKINLSSPPIDGHDYLNRVILEKRKIDDVVCAKIDSSKIQKQTAIIPVFEYSSDLSSELAPAEEWKQQQIADFSQIRRKLTFIKNSEKFQPSILKSKYKEDQWIIYCFGNDSTPEHKPLIKTLLSMSQPTILELLEYHISWLESAEEFTLQAGRWLYALLACLELPLDPETHSQIRTLARICANLRAKQKNPSRESVAPLSLMICLVSHYFRQMDLAD